MTTVPFSSPSCSLRRHSTCVLSRRPDNAARPITRFRALGGRGRRSIRPVSHCLSLVCCGLGGPWRCLATHQKVSGKCGNTEVRLNEIYAGNGPEQHGRENTDCGLNSGSYIVVLALILYFMANHDLLHYLVTCFSFAIKLFGSSQLEKVTRFFFKKN